jgi:hypothetical protein
VVVSGSANESAPVEIAIFRRRAPAGQIEAAEAR